MEPTSPPITHTSVRHNKDYRKRLKRAKFRIRNEIPRERLKEAVKKNDPKAIEKVKGIRKAAKERAAKQKTEKSSRKKTG